MDRGFQGPRVSRNTEASDFGYSVISLTVICGGVGRFGTGQARSRRSGTDPAPGPVHAGRTPGSADPSTAVTLGIKEWSAPAKWERKPFNERFGFVIRPTCQRRTAREVNLSHASWDHRL
jgi:hypothetical protein